MKANEKRPLACTTCAKAKSRCIPGPGRSEKCERCYRLNKTCLSRTPAPPRAKNHVKRSRVAELEKRLSELEGGRTVSPPLSGGEATTTASSAGEGKTPPNPLTFVHLFPEGDSLSAWPSKESVDAATASMRAWDSLWPLPAEAEMMLAAYHEKTAHLFPFVLVPRIRASELKEQRPFTWKAIMMVCCFLDGARHARLGEELLADISKAAMVDGLKSLDLLYGLQMLVAWFHYALKSTRLTNLLFLARSMSLGLDMNIINSPPEEAVSRDLDHLRAYAGTYYLNTLVFTTNKRTEVLMNTSYLDKCCSILETAKQYKSDEFLVKLVRVQQLAQSISLTLALEPGQQPMQLPLTIVVQSFQDQLSSFRQTLPPELEDNAMLQSHVYIAEVLLTDFAISDRHCYSSTMALTDRLRLLWSCLRSIRSMFTARGAVWNDLDSPRFLCLHGSDVSYALITAVRLVTLRLPGWNLEHIERELGFNEIMDCFINHMTTVVNRRRSGVFSVALKSDKDDTLEVLLNLCKGLRGHVKAEMRRAVEECKAESGFESAPPAAAGGVTDDFGDEFWRDLMIDTFWNGPGELDMELA